MIKPVFVPNIPKVYIEEEGKRIEVENVTGIYPEEKRIDILPNFREESNYILRGRVYLLEPFEVFISFENKEISFLGCVDLLQTEGFSPDYSRFGPAFGPLEMCIYLYPKE